MNLHVAVLAGVVEVTVGFIVELVVHWEADGWNHVEARDVATIPGFASISTLRRDADLRHQSWSHYLALLRSDSTAKPQRVFANNFLNLVNSMLQHSLEGHHKVYWVKVIDVVMAVPREASTARKHESHVCVDVKRVARASEFTRAAMLVVRQVSAHVLTRKVSVEDHVLARHLFVVQRYNKSIAQMT